MIVNIITCVVCLVMLILFRKLDRTNLKMSKLRRYSSRLFDEFKKMAETENRRFNDATIEMDILIKKSDFLSKSITASLREIETRLHGIDIEKTNLKKVDEDIRVISQSARDVNKQIEFIAGAKESFIELSQNTAYLKESIRTLKSESADMLQNFSGRLKEKSKEITTEFNEQFARLRESLDNKEDAIINASRQKGIELAEHFERSIADMESRVEDTGAILLQNFKIKIDGVAKSIEGASNLQNQVEMLKINYADLEGKIFSEIKERTVLVENEVNQSIDKLSDKLIAVETAVNDSKSRLIKTFEIEVDKVRSELDNLSIHAISKKDEIVNATRREAEEIRKEIDNFEERFLGFENRLIKTADARTEDINKSTEDAEQKLIDLENRLIKTADARTEDINKSTEDVEQKLIDLEKRLIKTADARTEDINKNTEDVEQKLIDFENQLMKTAEAKNDTIIRSAEEIEQRLQKYENQVENLADAQIQAMKEDFSAAEQRLLDIKKEVINYEEQSKIFMRTEAMANDLNGSIDHMNRMLEHSQEEAQKLEKFLSDIDYIKELAKEYDREIRAYQNKKEKLADIESEIKSLQEIGDYALDRANNCQEQFTKIDAVSSRIDALVESYGSLDLRIRELHEYEDVITKNLDSVNKADILIQSMDGKINTFQKVVDRAEKRVDKINQHLRDVEENTIILKTRESEIKEVKDKFSELDGLSEHMEARIKQIYAMFQKVETLRDEISMTDSHLQELFTETDRKMKQLADFIQAADNNNPILKQVKGSTLAAKNMNENVIRMVRDLSTKGWSSDEISRKLMMDENAVRLIINTSSL